MNKATDIECVSKCTLCPALGKEHVPAIGNSDAKLFIVGQSPGVNEVEAGQPFVGPSGELLDYLLDDIGITREQVYITNALKCHPPGNRAGHPEELRECYDAWLGKEIKYLKPTIIVIVGRDAWQSVTKGNIEFGHGKVTKTKLRTYVTIYHPAYFIRRGEIQEFLSVSATIKGLLDAQG